MYEQFEGLMHKTVLPTGAEGVAMTEGHERKNIGEELPPYRSNNVV